MRLAYLQVSCEMFADMLSANSVYCDFDRKLTVEGIPAKFCILSAELNGQLNSIVLVISSDELPELKPGERPQPIRPVYRQEWRTA